MEMDEPPSTQGVAASRHAPSKGSHDPPLTVNGLPVPADTIAALLSAAVSTSADTTAAASMPSLTVPLHAIYGPKQSPLRWHGFLH